MRKKAALIVLALIAVFAVFGIPFASAAEDYSETTYAVTGGNIYLRLETDYYEGTQYWVITGCEGSVTEAEIPDRINDIPVTEIEGGIVEGAFNMHSNLVKIVLPNGISYLPDCCFAGCTSLKYVTLPSNLDRIGRGAFRDCSSLESITIPASVVDIGVWYAIYDYDGNPFWGCDSLKNIYVNQNNQYYTSVNGIVFSKDKKEIVLYPAGKTATSYTVPSGVTEIGAWAFSKCDKLKFVTLPNGLQWIGLGAFDGCSLTAVSLPSTVESIGDYAFRGITVEEFVIPKNMTNYAASTLEVTKQYKVESGNAAFCTVDGVLFTKDMKTLVAFPNRSETCYVVPNGVERIEDQVFKDNDKVDEIVLPNSLKSVGVMAFGWYSGAMVFPGDAPGVDYHELDCYTFTDGTIYYPYYANGWDELMDYYSFNSIDWISYNPAEIVSQPQSKTVAVGNTATFSLETEGWYLTYQWQYKAPGSIKWQDSTQTGATASTLSIVTTANHNGYQYRCAVYEANGIPTFSNPVTLTVTPKITTQPTSKSVTVGSTAVFTVAANGKATLKYQWQAKAPGSSTWSNSTQSGATTAKLSVSTNVNHNGYQYRCVVTDGNGKKAYSSAATLMIKPKITTQPESKSVAVGNTAEFTVAATGKATLKYQWQAQAPGSSTWSNSTQTGATTAKLKVTTNTNHNGYKYRCVVTDGNGKKSYSSAATLTIVPKITKKPASTSATVGSTATFTITADGKATLKYQWQAKAPGATTWTNSTQSGAKTSKLSIATQVSHNGYQYRCVVTDGNGKKTYSSAATLYVLRITTQPASKSVTVGNTATFSVAATGKPTLQYQWQCKAPGATTWSNSTQTGAKTATLSVATNENHNGYQYRCVVTDATGKKVYSSAATLTITPKILKQPASTSVTAGSTAAFFVTATGKATLTYQWQCKAPGASTWSNSTQSGAKTSKLSVATTINHNGYQYRCVVTDGNDKKSYSSAATLTVKTGTTLTITSQPKSVTAAAGTSTSFTVEVSGNGPFTYQWQYKAPGSSSWNNSTASSATTSKLLSTVKTSMSGYQFRCVVKDAGGNQVISNAATMTAK